MTTYENINFGFAGRHPEEVWEFELPDYKNKITDWHCPICGDRVDDIHDAHLYETFCGMEIYHRGCWFDDEAREEYFARMGQEA